MTTVVAQPTKHEKSITKVIPQDLNLIHHSKNTVSVKMTKLTMNIAINKETTYPNQSNKKIKVTARIIKIFHLLEHKEQQQLQTTNISKMAEFK